MLADVARRALLEQRSVGAIRSCFGISGIASHREEGCLKMRSPQGSAEAILINTSGGLAGGDRLSLEIAVKENSAVTVTSQAAERVYRSIGPPAEVSLSFDVAEGASLCWLPQETILFDGGALKRTLNVQLAGTATFLGIEAVVLGRAAMGETLRHLELRDDWNIRRDGSLMHAERLRLGPGVPNSGATLGEAKAFATLVLVSAACEQRLQSVRAELGGGGCGVSCWNGKLVARLCAQDGFQLRKRLKAVIVACLAGRELPKTWTL